MYSYLNSQYNNGMNITIKVRFKHGHLNWDMAPNNNDTKTFIRSIDLFNIIYNHIELMPINNNGTIQQICRLKNGIPKLVSYNINSCMGNASLYLDFSEL